MANNYKKMKDQWHYQHVCRIPHDDMQKVREIARQQGDSINETILKYITWGLEVECSE